MSSQIQQPTKTPVAALQTMVDGQIVCIVEATVTSIGKYVSGDSQARPGEKYSFQDIVIADGGVTYKATLVDRKELPQSVLNKRLLFLAHRSDRGWTGLKIKPRKQKDNTFQNVLWVTGSAEITGLNESVPQNAPASAPANAAPPAQHAPQPAKPSHTGPAHANSDEENFRLAKRYLNRLANLYRLCLTTGEYIESTLADSSGGMPPEQKQACVSALFIQATRDGWTNYIPTGDINRFLPQSDPQPPAE